MLEKKHLFIPLVLAALLWNSACKSKVEAAQENALSQAAPAKKDNQGGEETVSIETASRQFIEVKPAASEKSAGLVRAPARIAFRDHGVARVAAPIDGRVADVHVNVGDRVRAGDPLVTLDSPAAAAIRAELEGAFVVRNAAKKVAERQAGMFERGVGIENEKLAAETELAKATAEVTRAQRTAAYLGAGSGAKVIIRAPIEGTVLDRRITVGATAGPSGEPLVVLGDPSAVWVVADVFERDLQLVAPGAGVILELPTSHEPLRGKVSSIGTALTVGLRTAPVFITLGDDTQSLRPGMYARATIEARTLEGVTLPVTAVLIKDGRKSVVFVEKDERTFVRREVTVGPSFDGHVQVIAGLMAGEKVVLKGALLLDGAADQLL